MTPEIRIRVKLMEMILVAPNLSAIKPLGTEKRREDKRGIETIKLTMKKDNSYSLRKIGSKASGSSV
jgi:hypothetical protein